MHVRLVIDGTELHGSLDDTAAGRDFASLLPLTLTISDFHATEKISDLPRKLNIKGAPAGSEPAAGDITYYAPWGNLALFYRDFAHSDGLVKLGQLTPDAARFLAALEDGTTLSIDSVD